MAVTYDMVLNRLGDIEQNLGTGSAGIVATMISGAQAEIDQLTNSSTGTLIDFAVADLATAHVVDSLLGRDDLPTSNQRAQMSTNFKRNAYMKLNAVGHDVKYSMVNK